MRNKQTITNLKNSIDNDNYDLFLAAFSEYHSDFLAFPEEIRKVFELACMKKRKKMYTLVLKTLNRLFEKKPSLDVKYYAMLWTRIICGLIAASDYELLDTQFDKEYLNVFIDWGILFKCVNLCKNNIPCFDNVAMMQYLESKRVSIKLEQKQLLLDSVELEAQKIHFGK